MSRRRPAFTKAEIERATRAAKEAGAAELVLRLNDQSSIVIRLTPSPPESAETDEIKL